MIRTRGYSNLPAVIFLAMTPVLAVLFSFMLPYGASFWKAFSAVGEVSALDNAAIRNVTFFTLKQAFLSVLVSLALGLPGAWFMGSSRHRFSGLLRAVTAVPFAMPSILVVLGFVLFFGNSGWLNRLYLFLSTALTGTAKGHVQILYKPEAIILAHGFFNFPLVIRLAGDGLGRARSAYAPAAASLGASPLKIAFTVILPLAVPGLLSAVLLVFLYCFTSFAVVLVLGGGPASTTLAVEIYRHARIFLNYHNAGVLALIETLIAVSLFLAYALAAKNAWTVKTDVHEQSEHENEYKKGTPVSLAIRIVYYTVLAFLVLGPLLSIPLESLLSRPSRSASQILSLRWWQSLGDTCLPALLRSLMLAFFSAAFSCVLAVLAAGSLTVLSVRDRKAGDRPNPALANLIRFCAAAPVVSSGIVLGFGWIILYGRNSRSPFALLILHSVSALPFTFNFIAEGFRSIPANTLNAASVFGAGPLRGLLTTALPLSLKRVRSAWGFAAALSLGELNAVMMLGMEGWETLPLYIYRAAGAYRYGNACAAGTLLILGCAACFLLSETGGKRNA